MCATTARKPYQILSREVWLEIRRQYIAGCGPAEICRRFGVARSTLTTKRTVENWDKQRAAARQIRQGRSALGSSRDGAERSIAFVPMPVQPDVGGGGAQQPLPARGRDGPGDCVRTDFAREADSKAGAVNDAYLKLAEALRRRVDLLVVEESLGATSGARPSRDVLDAATALEKLQRVERVALGLHDRDVSARTNVVILVPPKLTPDEWQEKARQSAGWGARCELLNSRSSAAEGDGRAGEDEVEQ